MTQQYQHIEPAGERIKRWLISERRKRKAAARRGDQIYMTHFPFMITAEELLGRVNGELVRRRERDKKAILAPPAKHPLLMPPFVKEK